MPIQHRPRIRLLFALLAGAFALQPLVSAAQGTGAAGPWRYRASIYGYFPSVSGSSSTQPPAGGPSIEFDGSKFLDNLQGAFFGSFEANNGRWGFYTDYMYISAGKDIQGSRDFSIGGSGIAASTSANLGWDLKGSVWTLAGEYRMVSDPVKVVDLLLGARMFDIKQNFRWDIAGSIGALPEVSRSGSSERSETNWDAIVGVKGRYSIGTSRRWGVPFYLDVGTGESKLTWQAAAGVSYAFSWGELSGLWRHLAYEMKSGKPTKDLRFSGPMVGATFSF